MSLKWTCCLVVLGVMLSTTSRAQEDKSYLRIRLTQASALLAEKAEKGKYLEGTTEVDMSTVIGGLMLSYGTYGVGQSTLNTSIDAGSVQHTLTSKWQEGAFIFGVTRTTTLTLGGGLLSEGKGTVTYSGTEYTSTSVSGNSWFALFGLEYVLPLTIDFIPLEYVEVLVGYRENWLKYGGYQSGSTTLDSTVKVKSVQTLLGFGAVF